MDDILYCADHHFLHQAVLGWCKRPFDNLDDMTEFMIEAHNAVAERSTEVFMLGDFAVGRDERSMRRIFDKMRGRKHLIIGNHDHKEVQRLNWSSDPCVRKTVVDGNYRIFLDHLPAHSWPGMYPRNPDRPDIKAYHFYGHTHGRLPSRGRSMDVGVDTWGYGPIRAIDAIDRMKEWNADYDTYAPERSDIIRSAEENLDRYDEDYEIRGPDYEPPLMTLVP